MASEKYILVRPPQLPELQAIGQGVYLVGYDQQTDRTVKVNVQSIGGGEQAPDLNWRADTEYNSDSIVEFGLRLWKSLVDNNVGNIPMEGDNWTEVSRASAATTSIPNWAAGVYTHSPALVLRNNAIYRLTRPVPFESTDFEAEAAAPIPVWTKVSGGGGHIFEDQSGNTLPTRNVAKAGAGIEFEDDAVGEKTVVRASKNLTDHIDGADEEKHTSNQIDHGGDKLSSIIPQLVNLADIDVSDISVGEKKIIVAEKNAQGDPIFAGGVGLLDVIANPGLSTLLSETNPNWVGDEITLTGNNLEGQLGENSQFFELDADFFLCTSHDNGTTTSNGSATWKRNRGTDSLSLSIPAHVTIINQLETEAGWNAVAQFKQITAKSKQGSWFRRSSGGYLYMCLDTSNGWTRVGTPPTVDLEITTTSHPVLTASLAAHDFTTNRFYVEGTEPADEPAEQGQEWWDTTNKYVYRRNMDGNWARLNG